MILAYLSENPEAEDTVEGVVEWWLLEEEIRRRTSDVKQALTDLVARGLVLERPGPDQRNRYRLNGARRDEVRRLLHGG